MMTTTATDDDWEDVLLVVTHTEDAKNYRYTHEPMPAGEVMEHFGGDGDAWATMRDHIIGVAEHGGEGTAFVDGHGYHVRRATRAEALGQEDRLHEAEDAPDVFSLREQLDEALETLGSLVHGADRWADELASMATDCAEDDPDAANEHRTNSQELDAAVQRARTILAKAGR